MATADPKNTDARVGVGMMHHNVGLARRSTDGPAASLEDFEKARTFYEPVLAADPTNTWVEGMLAKLHFDIGSAEEGSASAPGVRPPDQACRSYVLSATTFAKLKAAGRLASDRDGNAREAEEARRRCERRERPDPGG
jgi:hypothetical protein